MGLEKFCVLFDNPQGVYYGGQTITGKVQLVINSDKKVRAINVTIKGQAEVQWEETRTATSNTDTRSTVEDKEIYKSEEMYFENKIMVFGGGNDATLPAGEHFFPFGYVLPTTCPSSFEGEYGHVRYTVKAVIDRPWKFDHETKTAFTIINALDLNATPKLMEPIQTSKEKTFCCFCCASAPLTVNLLLPSGGAVPGQVLVPTIEVENKSNVQINQLKLLFVKTITYHARGSSKMDSVNISEKNLGIVQAGNSNTWPQEALQIPALPPSNLNNCSIIDLAYCVKVQADTSGVHRNVSLKLPVVLGTIPFHQQFTNFQSAPSQPPLGWNLAPSAPQLDGSPNYPDLPPPTFEDSVGGSFSTNDKTDSQFVYGDKTYAPKYPVYCPNQ